MIKNLLLVGNSGTGKSSSFRNLPLEKTIWINTEKKSLPFKGQKKLLQNIILKDVDEMIQGMAWIEEQEKCEYVVIDSFSMLMDMFYMKHIATADARKTQQAWGEYKTFGMNVLELMKQSSKFYIVTALAETKNDRFGSPDKECAKVQGSLGGGGIEPHFTVVAHTDITQHPETKELNYGFILGKTSSRPLVTAKSPMDFLSGVKEVDNNDITILTNEILEYIES
jgi:hypothetical protein